MNLIRQWSFPVAVLAGWIVLSAYTISALSELPPGQRPPVQAPAAQATRHEA